ncbi:MAG: hypothetical protein JXR30_01385 [Alphaproteobacteria bacterium]|nr:hypothetical protein [Alphaproteobacteria bacterium]
MEFLTFFECSEKEITACVIEAGAQQVIRAKLSVPCQVISRGLITHAEDFQNHIQDMRDVLESQLGFPLHEVYLIVRGLPVESKVLYFSKTFEDAHPIKGIEIQEILSENRLNKAFENDRVLHSFPLRYKLDDRSDIENPEGLIGQTLGVACHFIKIPQKIYESYLYMFKKARLNLVKMIESSYATSFGVLNDETKKAGTLLINFYDKTTELLVYEKKTPLFLHQFPFGIDLILQDLQKYFSLSERQAKKLFREHARALVLSEDHLKNVTFDFDEKTSRTFPLLDITRLTSARMKEIMRLIYLFLEKKKVIPYIQGIQITGDVFHVKHLNQLGYNIFNCSVNVFEEAFLNNQRISHAIKGAFLNRVAHIEKENRAFEYQKKSSHRTFELLRKFIQENL